MGFNLTACDVASNLFDEGLTQSPTADATTDPNEGPATTNLHGEDYVLFEEQVVEVVCQSHDTLTSELSFLHHDGMVLKASDDSLMSEASPYDMSHLDLQPQVQEKPTLNISSMDFHTEPDGQRFISMYSIGNLLGSGGFGLVHEGVRKSDGQQVAFKFILEKDLHLHINLCDVASNPFDEGLTQSPTADATADPNEGPATTNLHGEDYVLFEEQVVEVVCQSHDTLTSELSFLHHDGMVLKASDDSLMSEASPYDMSHLDLQPQVQEKPTLNISSMDFHTEPDGQRFISMYSIGDLLGSGGFGLVHEGVRKSDGQQVAIKFIPGKDSHLHINLPGETCKLHIEVALMKIVSKPPLCKNVLQLLDWFEVSNFLLLVLERPVPCMDVFSFYKSEGWLLDDLLAKIILLQVVEAANHCYKLGVFHSDIKMENLLFNPDTLDVKLIDFGCGDLWQDTPYNKFRGTRGFQPPEWILQQQYHAYPATVWTLGILLYNLACGEMPFSDEEEIIDGTLTFGPGPSEDCLHLIKWCLQQNPAKRPSFRQISQHPWFTKGLHLTDMGLQEEMGGVKSKADDTLMPEMPHQRKVGVLQSSDMGTQRSNYAFPEHVDPQQILKTLKMHFVL